MGCGFTENRNHNWAVPCHHGVRLDYTSGPPDWFHSGFLLKFPLGEARFLTEGGHQDPGEGFFLPSELLLKQISPGLGQSWKHQEWSQQGWRNIPPFQILLVSRARYLSKGQNPNFTSKVHQMLEQGGDKWAVAGFTQHPRVPFLKIIQLIQCLTSPSEHLALGKRLPDFHLVMENNILTSNCARGAAPLQVRPGVRASVHPSGLHH